MACMDFVDVKSMVAYLLTFAKQDLHADTDLEDDDSSSYDGDDFDDGDEVVVKGNACKEQVQLEEGHDEEDEVFETGIWQIDLGCEEKQECCCMDEALCEVGKDEVHFDEEWSASKDVLNTDVADKANPSMELDIECVSDGIGGLFDGEELDSCFVESMSEGVTVSSGPEEPEETVQVMTPEEMDYQESVSETASEVTNPSPSKIDEVSVECVQLDVVGHYNKCERSEVDRDLRELDPELEALLDEIAMGFLVCSDEVSVHVPSCQGKDQLEISLVDGCQLDKREDESLVNNDAEFDAILDSVLEDFVCLRDLEAKQVGECSGHLKACETVEALAGELEIPCIGDGEQDMTNGVSSVQVFEGVDGNVEPGNSLVYVRAFDMCEEYASTVVDGMYAKTLDQAHVDMDSGLHDECHSKCEGQVPNGSQMLLEKVFGEPVNVDTNFGQMVPCEDMQQQCVVDESEKIDGANAWCVGVDNEEFVVDALSNQGLVAFLMWALSAELMHGMAIRFSWDPGGRVI